MLLALVVTVPIAGLLVAFSWAEIVRGWTGMVVATSMALLLGLGVWMVVCALGNTVSTFLNGANLVGTQAVIALPLRLEPLSPRSYSYRRSGWLG